MPILVKPALIRDTGLAVASDLQVRCAPEFPKKYMLLRTKAIYGQRPQQIMEEQWGISNQKRRPLQNWYFVIVKRALDSVFKSGKDHHTTTTAKLDGKPFFVPNDPTARHIIKSGPAKSSHVSWSQVRSSYFMYSSVQFSSRWYLRARENPHTRSTSCKSQVRW